MSEELEHSLFGPSGASGWRRCPGKINAERGLPDKAGREAAEGTVFHEYAAMCLQFGLEPDDFPLGVRHLQDGWEITFDEDMVLYMHAGLDWVRDEIEPGDILYVERRVDISPWCGPGEFGTSDVCILKIAKRQIKSFDWKYGKGVVVSPVKNDQQYLYTLGQWHTFAKKYFIGVDPEDIEVEFYIEQPRAPGGGGSWKTTMAECLAEGEKIKEDAEAARDPHAVRVPGEKQCTFCRASGNCGPQAKWLVETYGQKFEDFEENIEMGVGPAFEDPMGVDPLMRSYMLLHWRAFKRFVDRVHAIVLHDLKAGREVPLLKAVAGRPGHRKYIEGEIETVKETLVKAVGDKAFEPIKPAAAEKLIGKKAFKEKLSAYVTQPPPKPILVALDDKRPALQDLASKYADFDDESDDDNEEED